jgi:hypothetical protein
MRHVRKWDICVLLAAGISVSVGELRFLYEADRGNGFLTVTCVSNLLMLREFLVEDAPTPREPLPLSLLGLTSGRDLGTLRCPCKRPPCQWSAEGRVEVDYEYVGGGLTWPQVLSVPRFPLAFDRLGNHADGTRSVVFAERKVEVMGEDEFQQTLMEAIRVCGNDDALKARLLPYVPRTEGRDMPAP